MKENIKIKKTEENPESTELLAQSIIRVADGFAKLLSSSLTERAYLVLLQDMCGSTNISKTQIQLVLKNLPRLKAWYVRK